MLSDRFKSHEITCLNDDPNSTMCTKRRFLYSINWNSLKDIQIHFVAFNSCSHEMFNTDKNNEWTSRSRSIVSRLIEMNYARIFYFSFCSIFFPLLFMFLIQIVVWKWTFSTDNYILYVIIWKAIHISPTNGLNVAVRFIWMNYV